MVGRIRPNQVESKSVKGVARMKPRFKVLSFLLSVVAGGVLLGAGAGPAGAAGLYASWTISPEDPDVQNHSGTLTFPNAQLPGASFTANKDLDDGQSTRIATGTGTYGDWLTTETPFGAVFGPSGPSTTIQFLRQRIDTETVATTTYTFNKPFPANRLGFAFGDIDVDFLTITATDGNGNPVPGSKLVGGVFNYCDVTVDKPTDCDDGPYTNPVWTPGPNGGTVTPTPPNPDIEESSGSSAWFRPTVKIKTLTVVFQAYPSAGSPSYRTWIAALPRTKIATTVETSKRRIKPGQKVKLRVKTRNTGSFTGNDVKTCVKIPKGFVVVNAGGTKVKGRKACWTRGSLAAGKETSKSIVLRSLKSTRGKFSFPDTATSSDAGTDKSSDVTRVVAPKKPKPDPKPEPPAG
jgi:hypothetical protein